MASHRFSTQNRCKISLDKPKQPPYTSNHRKQCLINYQFNYQLSICLEVLIVRGKSGEIKEIGDRLIGARGVKHGKLSLTTTGKDLT
ncbi:MAG: hypothetical protein GW875_14925 [Deltaproteobacteria bacterium]|nr:hypothetical protein [Deltaproteobacteria bacterium]